MPHARFRRSGNNLHTVVTLTLEEALLGFTKEIEHLDDHIVTIEKTKVTQPGKQKTSHTFLKFNFRRN